MDINQLTQWLRDPLWGGVAGVITLLLFVGGLLRIGWNFTVGRRTHQGLIDAVKKTWSDVIALTRWLARHIVRNKETVAGFLGALFILGTAYLAFGSFLASVLVLLIATVIILLSGRASYKPAYIRIDLSPISSGDLNTIYRDLPQGDVLLCNVPFRLETSYFDTSTLPTGQMPAANERRLATPVYSVRSLHVLINVGNGWKEISGVNVEGVTIGRIQLVFRGGGQQEEKIILGKNVREWAYGNSPGKLVDKVSSLASQVAWKGRNVSGREAVIDKLEIPIHPRYRKEAVEKIVVFKDAQPGTPEGALQLLIFAITLECDRLPPFTM